MISPAFISASIAICLPGIESRVNRAATSDTRPAPFVMTMNWITIRIMKITNPTTRFPPTTNFPNASTTPPAFAFKRISRVVATFSPSRNSVSSSRSDGNVEKSSGWRTVRVISSSKIVDARLNASSMSSTNVGSGTRNTTRRPSSAKDSISSLRASSGRVVPAGVKRGSVAIGFHSPPPQIGDTVI
ncbi:hypothetical protein FTUN_1920 [Frigoriglobus tundricola]|uniref:Uncharacterized protein n=1 Tax=Frigoriglobus tundricola TaxID=2774151 RepID=A0A6M5YM20_9BACT|nr:hypothetical protein FTUN_1920 [Frigoriglobus tundricola]